MPNFSALITLKKPQSTLFKIYYSHKIGAIFFFFALYEGVAKKSLQILNLRKRCRL